MKKEVNYVNKEVTYVKMVGDYRTPARHGPLGTDLGSGLTTW